MREFSSVSDWLEFLSEMDVVDSFFCPLYFPGFFPLFLWYLIYVTYLYGVLLRFYRNVFLFWYGILFSCYTSSFLTHINIRVRFFKTSSLPEEGYVQDKTLGEFLLLSLSLFLLFTSKTSSHFFKKKKKGECFCNYD